MAAPPNPLQKWLLVTPKKEPGREEGQSSATPDAPSDPRQAAARPRLQENVNMMCASDDENLEEDDVDRVEDNEEQAPASSRPATINSEIVAIGGGYLASFRTDILLRQWVTEVHTIAGRRFVALEKKDKRLAAWLGGRWAMVDHMKELRNRYIEDRFSELVQAQDDQCERPAEVWRGKRKSMADDLEEVVTVPVKTANGLLDMAMVTNWKPNSKLMLEITEANLNALLEEPIDTRAWVPAPKTHGVHYQPHGRTGHRLYGRWYDAQTPGWRYHFEPLRPDVLLMARDQAIQHVNDVALAVAEWVRVHHTPLPVRMQKK